MAERVPEAFVTAMSQRVSADVEGVLRGHHKAVPGTATLDDLRAAFDLIAKTGPEPVRPMAETVLSSLPASGHISLTVDDVGRYNMNGALQFAPDVHIRLFTAEGRTGLTYETLFHESLHGVVATRYRTIRDQLQNPSRNPDVESSEAAVLAFAKFSKIWKEFRELSVKDVISDRELNIAVSDARLSPDEFFAHSLTNPRFQQYLDTKKTAKKTLFTRFKDWVKSSLLPANKDSRVQSLLEEAVEASLTIVRTLNAPQTSAPGPSSPDVADEDLLLRSEKQIRSLEFTSWFGDSKMVDDEGKPAVWHHGGARTFANGGPEGQTMWLSSSAEFSDTFSRKSQKTYSLYVKASNPFDPANPEHIALVAEDLDRLFSNSSWNDWRRRMEESHWRMFDDFRVHNVLLRAGFDAAFMEEDNVKNIVLIGDVAGRTKSATRNNGEFNPAATSILHDRAGFQEQGDAFKQWFGESKIVDVNGQPLVVYHGTGKDFSIFQSTTPQRVLVADGVQYTSADPWELGPDATGKPESIHYGAWADAMSIPIEKALLIRENEAAKYGSSDPDTARHIADLRRLAGKTIEYKTVEQPTGDGFYFTPDGAGYASRFASRGDGGNVVPVYLNIRNPIFLNSAQIESAGASYNVEKYKALGYDGAIFTEHPEDLARHNFNGATQIVAFYPQQVKSAVGNNGDFNPSDPDILHSASSVQESTPEFQTWFGNSKITNADGSPRVLYHGTGVEFDKFDNTKDRKGNNLPFFATDPGFANEWLDDRYRGDVPHIVPVYVKAENPWDYQNPTHVSALAEALDNAGTEYEREALEDGDWSFIENTPGAIDAIKRMGHDGIFLTEGSDADRNLAVFDPTQVKSAIGNRGTFDPSNPSMLLSTSKRQEESDAFKKWFAGSKVADPETGAPLVVYRGSVFDEASTPNLSASSPNNRFGRALYAGSLGIAEEYTHPYIPDKQDFVHKKTGEASKRFETKQGWIDFVNANYRTDEWYELIGAADNRGVMYPLYMSIKNPARRDTIVDGLSVQFWADEAVRSGTGEQLKERLIKHGYDGVIFETTYRGKDVTEYVAFDPSQVKSAIGNNGDFDPTNANILRSSSAKQQDTAEFKSWFKKSAVTAEDGVTPLVVYHGTSICGGTRGLPPGTLPKDAFTVFDKKLLGAVSDSSDAKSGFWFTADMGRAEDAAWDAKQYHKETWGDQLSAYVYQVYLSIQNPLVIDSVRDYMPDEIAKIARKARRAGHDGLIFRNGEGNGADYLVFDATQIKSAIANDGAFDPSNPNILKSRRDDDPTDSPEVASPASSKIENDTLKSTARTMKPRPR